VQGIALVAVQLVVFVSEHAFLCDEVRVGAGQSVGLACAVEIDHQLVASQQPQCIRTYQRTVSWLSLSMKSFPPAARQKRYRGKRSFQDLRWIFESIRQPKSLTALSHGRKLPVGPHEAAAWGDRPPPQNQSTADTASPSRRQIDVILGEGCVARASMPVVRKSGFTPS
jgi:hypothetical protein